MRWDQDGALSEREDKLSAFLTNAAHPLAQQTGLPLQASWPWSIPPTAQRAAGRTPSASSSLPVLRAGYGIFWLPLSIARRDNLVQATATGSSPFLGLLNGGLTPYRTLSNPFPNGITQPVGRDPEFPKLPCRADFFYYCSQRRTRLFAAGGF